MFLIYTERETKFSKEKIINVFLLSSAFVGARLMSAGSFNTGIPENIIIGSRKDSDGTIIPIRELKIKMTGTMMNPALAFGTQIVSLEFTYFFHYTIMPLCGALVGFLFHELVFKRTQEILNITD
jgi:hypothetical protein